MPVPPQMLPRNWLLPKLLPRERVAEQVATFVTALDPGHAYRVTVEEAKPTRSSDQNNALWGCAYKAIREQTGNDPDDLHVYFCGEYFGWVECEMFGAHKKKPRRTTTADPEGRRSVMSKMEFVDFYAFIQQRMAENGVHVPDPDPYWRDAA